MCIRQSGLAALSDGQSLSGRQRRSVYRSKSQLKRHSLSLCCLPAVQRGVVHGTVSLLVFKLGRCTQATGGQHQPWRGGVRRCDAVISSTATGRVECDLGSCTTWKALCWHPVSPVLAAVCQVHVQTQLTVQDAENACGRAYCPRCM
jgi:hypothetical protein